MKKPVDTFSPGDLVIWRAGSTWSAYDVWGKVTRVTGKGTVFAAPLDRPDAEQMFSPNARRNTLRKPTEHELAHRMWWRRAPKGEYAQGRGMIGNREEVAGVEVEKVDTPAKARQAAAELLAFAVWWEEEPKS